MMIQRLALPHISRQAAASANSLSQARSVLKVVVDGVECTLSQASGVSAVIAEPLCVHVEWQGRSVRLRCPAAMLRQVLTSLEPGYAHRALPRGDMLALLLQLAAGPWPGTISAVLPDEGGLAGAMPVTLSVAGQDWPGELSGEIGIWLHEPGLTPVAQKTVLPGAVRFGTTQLPTGVVLSLRQGDAVLMQAGGLRTTARLVVTESWLAQLTQTSHGWRIEERPHPAASGERDWLMAGENGDEAAARPEDIEVTLAFDVGRTELTVGELSRLGVGSILDLRRNATDLIEIRANGRRIGRGELVDIDGSVGVRITQLFDGR